MKTSNSPFDPLAEANLTDSQLQAAARLRSTNDVPQVVHQTSIIQIILDTLASRRKTLPLTEIANADKALREYSAILSPVRRIPAEIICEIFAWTLPNTQVIHGYTVKVAPWTLGHICRRWRAVALGYSPLWTTIFLYGPRSSASLYPYETPGKDARTLQMVQTLLHRCGDAALLNVTMLLHHSDEVPQSKSFELLCSHSNRWETLNLWAWSLKGLQSVKGQLPLLRSLELLGLNDRGAFPEDVFSIAPSLHEILLTSDSYRHDSPSHARLLLPWSQLSYVRVSYRSHNNALELLRTIPELVECGIRVNDDYNSGLPFGIFPTVVAPHLRRLNLKGSSQVLRLITAPVLQELWISGTAATHLLGYLQRAGWPLITLVVTDECTAPDALIPVLAELPTLTTFFVLFERTAPREAQRRLLEALTVAPGSTTAPLLCPHLARLTTGDLNSTVLDALLDVADSRSSSRSAKATPLSFLRAFYTGPLMFGARDMLPRVERMVACGLDVSVHGEFKPGPRNYMGFGRP